MLDMLALRDNLINASKNPDPKMREFLLALLYEELKDHFIPQELTEFEKRIALHSETAAIAMYRDRRRCSVDEAVRAFSRRDNA